MVIRKAVTSLSYSRVLFVLILLAIAVIGRPAQAQTPVGYWKFDDGAGVRAVDSSGSGHAAILGNGVSWVPGKIGGAVSADAGRQQYGKIPAIDLSGTPVATVAFWSKRTYSTSGGHALFEATGSYTNSTTGFAFFPDDDTCGGIQIALRGDLGSVANCYAQPSSGIWHHFAVVFDKRQTGGDEIKLYVDGALQTVNRSLEAATNTNNFGNNPIYLFSRAGSTDFDSGEIDDFRIYSRALTAPQIQQVYSGPGLGTLSALISYVQGNYATPQTPQTTVNVPFTAAQVAGDLNVIVVGWNDSTATVTRVADSKGNTYTRAVGPTVQNGYASQSIYYAKNIVSAGAGTNTVTVTFSTAAVSPDIRILEYRGADTNNPVDVVAAASGNSASCNSGSATTTNPTDLIFGANLVQTVTTGPGSGFTSRLLTQPDGDIAEDKMVSATGSYSVTAPVSPSGPWIMQMVAFRTPASFTVAASPSSLSIAQGHQGTSTITTTLSGGFNSAISLTASGVPSGTTVTFNPTTIPAPGSGTSTMTITVGSTTPAGTYPITVTGNGGGSQQATTVTLTVTAPSFTIVASPGSLSITQGSQGTSTITTTVTGGFNNPISLSATGAPSGTTVSFNPSTLPAPGSGSSTMTITVGAATPLGTYPITVEGSGGGIQQSTTVTLTVTGPASFALSASPTSLSISQGHQGTSAITALAGGGFDSSITLSASGMPAGTTVGFNPTTIPAPGSGTSTMTITVGAATPIGAYPITVSGNGGGVQENAVVTLTVTASSSTITYVQGNYATPQSPQSTVSVAFTAAQLAGDLNVVAIGWNDSIATVSSVQDTKGNVYSLAVGPTIQSGMASQSIYYAKNIVAAPAGANTVTVTFTSAALSPDIRVVEYSGADPNNPVDVTAANSGNSASSSSGSATTTNAGDLIFGANLVQTLTSGPGSGLTKRLLTVPDGDIAEDEMVTSTGSYSATAPVFPSGPWIMQMVAFRTPTGTGFTISASPASVSIAPGYQGNSTITAAISGGFNSAITLSASGMPAGTTVSFNPQTIPAPGSGNSTMTITVGSSTPPGTYPITVTGNGGGIQQTTTVTLTVTAPANFTLSASPASLNVAQGTQGSSTITTAISGGFNSAITLSASGMPSGTTVSFNPQTIPAPGSGNSTMTITVGSSTPSGTYPITVTGNGGGIQQHATVTLTVTAGATFTISASPASLTVMQGAQGSSTITTAVSGGFNSAITLSASGLPAGTTVSFNPQTIPAPGSGNSTMTFMVGLSTPMGTYPIVVTGNGGGVQQSVTVNLTVTAQVLLSWTASTSPGIAGYNAYRSTVSGGPYTKVNSSLIPTTTYNDLTVQNGYTYYYVTTAVNQQGMESSYSNQSSATIP